MFCVNERMYHLLGLHKGRPRPPKFDKPKLTILPDSIKGISWKPDISGYIRNKGFFIPKRQQKEDRFNPPLVTYSRVFLKIGRLFPFTLHTQAEPLSTIQLAAQSVAAKSYEFQEKPLRSSKVIQYFIIYSRDSQEKQIQITRFKSYNLCRMQTDEPTNYTVE